MSQSRRPPATLTAIRPSLVVDPARREFNTLMHIAQLELDAIAAGDLAGFWGLHRAVNQALGLMLDHRLEVA